MLAGEERRPGAFPTYRSLAVIMVWFAAGLLAWIILLSLAVWLTRF